MKFMRRAAGTNAPRGRLKASAATGDIGTDRCMSLGLFDRFSNAVSRGAGRPATFVAACTLIAGWAISGPLAGFSETWQLVINTGTTIITFLMVFVLQHTQNRDNDAIQAKLDDLIYAVRKADNRLIGAEELTDKELQELRDITKDEVTRDATIIVQPKRRQPRRAETAKPGTKNGAAPRRSARSQPPRAATKGD
jgi:low affinity Fe/Cu permease